MKRDTPAARDISLAALNNIEKNRAYSALALQEELSKHALAPREQRLARRLVYGVVTYRLGLDYILNQFCRRKVSSLSPSLRNILRMACYQLVYLDRIPDFAAVNEAVNSARKIGGKGIAGFINGVLRNILRKRDTLFQDLSPDTIEGISILHSHPRWLVEKWVKQWGVDFTAQLCAANNRPVPLCIRVNTEKISREDYISQAEERGLAPRPGKHCAQAVVFPPDTSFSDLPGYEAGWFIVQGEAAMLPSRCLALQKGHDILDMCAAPGGKTTQMAAQVNPGRVLACDLHQSRLRLVQGNALRLGLNNIDTLRADASMLTDKIAPGFERILLDAPCSGLGVIRNKPDIKWFRSQEDIRDLVVLQEKLLHTACDLLSPGGILVYSTCTLGSEENEQVIETLLQQRTEMQMLKIDLPGFPRENFLTTFPHLHNLDGFFVAKLTKVV